MKLYVIPRAINPRRVLWFLAEKGMTIETVPLDMGKLEHKEPAYTAINPAQRAPALVLDDGAVITESVAICRYLEEIRSEPPLFGEGALERATVETWNRRAEFELMLPVAFTFRHSHPFMASMEVPQVPEWAEVSRSKVAPFLEVLDRHLADRTYLAGDRFTIADITAACSLDFMRLPKIPVPDGLDHLRRWREEVGRRPGASA
ncbi:MAG: glutathione S-transferase [Methylobacteriaceae bacterium]|nr:glutathione S-transferase [Methylobacteriaceae bacterium]